MTNAQYIIDDRIMSPKVNTLFWRTCYIKQEKYAPITQLPCVCCTTLVERVEKIYNHRVSLPHHIKLFNMCITTYLMSNETFPIFAHPYMPGMSRSSPFIHTQQPHQINTNTHPTQHYSHHTHKPALTHPNNTKRHSAILCDTPHRRSVYCAAAVAFPQKTPHGPPPAVENRPQLKFDWRQQLISCGMSDYIGVSEALYTATTTPGD